jgi:hypothetical protein
VDKPVENFYTYLKKDYDGLKKSRGTFSSGIYYEGVKKSLESYYEGD